MTGDCKFGLIGRNIAYSRSKQIFEAIFRIDRTDDTFEIFDVSPTDLEQTLRELTDRGFRGLSVTIPYKSMIIPLLYETDPLANALDAVNSVAIEDDRTKGYNTDCYGFAWPLRDYATRLKHGRALIFGCGGAARAACYSLYTDYEVDSFAVLSRSADHLGRFERTTSALLPNVAIETVLSDRLSGVVGTGYDIVVNCTPLGGGNYPDAIPFPTEFAWPSGKLYYDLNYNENNRAVRLAGEKSMRTIDGSAMLIGQAVRSFEIWTGINIPFDAVYQSVFGRI
ncbi:MAG: shikimate dehydrogenase [candidate division Zixibacteria bacterium]|nr:shikimate dehydrogenase [candidate division Zixibacteria bacterium]